MIPGRRASLTHSNDIVTSGVPFGLSGPSRSTPRSTPKPPPPHSHQDNHDNSYYYQSDYSLEPTYAEFLSTSDDWLDPYSLNPSSSSSSQRRKRSTTCGLKSDTSTIAYATSLRPRAKSLRDATKAVALPNDFEETAAATKSSGYSSMEKRWTDKATTKHAHLPRARSRILKSPPPPPAYEMDQHPPSLPNVDVQQIKDELSASAGREYHTASATPPPRRQKSLQHPPMPTTSKETASVISNVKRKLSLKDRAEPSPSSDHLPQSGRKSHTPASSLGDYQGPRSSSFARRRSAYSSPPPRSSNNSNSSRQQKNRDDGWATSDDDGRLSSTSSCSGTQGQDAYDYGFIPPVPPVPKHHSIRTLSNATTGTATTTTDDDDVILATLTAGSTQRNNNTGGGARGTFGSLEEIIQHSQHGYSDDLGDIHIPTHRTKTRTPKRQQEQQHQQQNMQSSPSLLPTRSSSRKNHDTQKMASQQQASQQKGDDGKKVANRKRGRVNDHTHL